MADRNSLTAARLRELLHYDPELGWFMWRVTRTFTAVAGAVAGRINPKGYVSIKINGYTYLAHRLAWLYVHGIWPDKDIDHWDTSESNNCFSNLREATPRLNNENRRVANRDNATGFLGVCFHKKAGKFQASIKVAGKHLHLGLYQTAELAHAAYITAKRREHAGCTL